MSDHVGPESGGCGMRDAGCGMRERACRPERLTAALSVDSSLYVSTTLRTGYCNLYERSAAVMCIDDRRATPGHGTRPTARASSRDCGAARARPSGRCTARSV